MSRPIGDGAAGVPAARLSGRERGRAQRGCPQKNGRPEGRPSLGRKRPRKAARSPKRQCCDAEGRRLGSASQGFFCSAASAWATAGSAWVASASVQRRQMRLERERAGTRRVWREEGLARGLQPRRAWSRSALSSHCLPPASLRQRQPRPPLAKPRHFGPKARTRQHSAALPYAPPSAHTGSRWRCSPRSVVSRAAAATP